MTPKFTIYKAKNDKFYFTLSAKNGSLIAQSQMYNSKSACENGIASVKANCDAPIDDQTGIDPELTKYVDSCIKNNAEASLVHKMAVLAKGAIK